MIGLDTNVLVRYVMQDDRRQSPRATRLIESLSAESPGFIPVVALVELVVERAELVAQALKRYVTDGADLADALIERPAAAAGCATTVTSDVGAVEATSMTLVP